MMNNDLIDDMVIIMANCDTPDEGRKIYENYVRGVVSISRQKAESIVRQRMDEETAKEISNGNEVFAKITPKTFVDYFISYSVLRFQCGMSKKEFKIMLDRVAKEVYDKYF